MVRVIQPVDLNPGDFNNPQTGAAGEIAIRVDAASGVGAAILAAVTPLAGAGAPSGAPAYPKLFYVDVSTTPNQHYWWNGSSWQLLGDGAGSAPDGVVTGASLAGTTLTLTRSVGAPVVINLSGLQDGTVTGASLAAGTLTLTRSIGAPITVNLSALQDGVITSLALVGTILTANRSVGAALTVDLATLAGAAPDGVVTGASLAGTTLTLTRSVGAPVTVNLSGLQDGVVTGASLAGTILTLTRSVGAPVTVDLAGLGGGGGSDGVVTAASLAGTTLTLTRSVGGPVTVNLAGLQDGTVTGGNFNTGTSVLTLNRSVGADLTFDLSALAGGGVTDLAYTASPANGIVTSSTGTDATIPLVTTVNAGLVPPRTGNATDVLLGDGTWGPVPAAIPGSGIPGLYAVVAVGTNFASGFSGAFTSTIVVPPGIAYAWAYLSRYDPVSAQYEYSDSWIIAVSPGALVRFRNPNTPGSVPDSGEVQVNGVNAARVNGSVLAFNRGTLQGGVPGGVPVVSTAVEINDPTLYGTPARNKHGVVWVAPF